MRPGGEAQDQDAGARVSETRYGACPVDLVHVGAAAGFADAGAVGSQALASFACDDAVADGVERGKRRAWLRDRLKDSDVRFCGNMRQNVGTGTRVVVDG
jgi:hypothetical protein